MCMKFDPMKPSMIKTHTYLMIVVAACSPLLPYHVHYDHHLFIVSISTSVRNQHFWNRHSFSVLFDIDLLSEYFLDNAAKSIIVLILYMKSITHINQTFTGLNLSHVIKLTLFITLLSLGGITAILGFLPKLLVIQYLVSQNQIPLLIIIVTRPLILQYRSILAVIITLTTYNIYSKDHEGDSSGEVIDVVLKTVHDSKFTQVVSLHNHSQENNFTKLIRHDNVENSVGFIIFRNTTGEECFADDLWEDSAFWNPQAFFLLVITEPLTEGTEEIIEMLKDCWDSFNILNMEVVFLNLSILEDLEKTLDLTDDIVSKMALKILFINDDDEALNLVAFSRNISRFALNYEGKVLITKPEYFRNGRALIHIVEECYCSTLNIFQSVENHSPFLIKFNDIIVRLNEAGFIQQWKKELLNDNLLLSNKNSRGSNNPVVLTLDHLQAVFIILGFGLSIASIIFLVEMISKHLVRLKIRVLSPIRHPEVLREVTVSVDREQSVITMIKHHQYNQKGIELLTFTVTDISDQIRIV
uniref:Uncharacterized protein n=1 Tax=Timema poppense TaxID=170557 RepID=A0A7R9D962_TIMPO|nr:unnamed protein product [Timema poppensis]